MDTEDSKRKLNTQILEEAAEWLVEFNSGEADPSARPKFDAWLRASPAHVSAYLELLPIWEEGAAMPLHANASAEDFIALARNADNIAPLGLLGKTYEPPAPLIVSGAHRQRFALVAATALVAAFVGALTWIQLVRNPTYTTQVGEQRSISLADGSMIELNARSQVRIHFSNYVRSVDLLEGQALFHVAKDHARPFVVTSDGTQVRAVGTEFDVYQKRGGTIVTVVEGRVSIIRRDAAPSGSAEGLQVGSATPDGPANTDLGAPRALYVSAGEQVTVTAAAAPRATRANIAAATAWTQHRIVFDAATLGDVVEEFNRYNARPLILRDTALASFPISAAFSSTDPASLVRFLQAQPGIKVTAGPDEIEIAPRR